MAKIIKYMKNKWWNYSKNNQCECGKLISDEAISCNHCARLGVALNPDSIKKMVETRKRNGSYEWSKKSKKKLSKSISGKNNGFYGKHHTEKVREKLSKLHKGQKATQETRNKMSKALRKKWLDYSFRIKRTRQVLKGLNLRPNKPEKLLKELLNNLFPKQYKFVGSGQVILNGFNPDFINTNGQKKIIELYGCYWHRCKICGFGTEIRPKDIGRLKEYSKLGYLTLIIWEHELRKVDRLSKKLIKFNEVQI